MTRSQPSARRTRAQSRPYTFAIRHGTPNQEEAPIIETLWWLPLDPVAHELKSPAHDERGCGPTASVGTLVEKLNQDERCY